MDELYVGAHVIVNKDNCFRSACAQYHGEIISETQTRNVWIVRIFEAIRDEDEPYGLKTECRVASCYMGIDDEYEDLCIDVCAIDISDLL